MKKIIFITLSLVSCLIFKSFSQNRPCKKPHLSLLPGYYTGNKVYCHADSLKNIVNKNFRLIEKTECHYSVLEYWLSIMLKSGEKFDEVVIGESLPKIAYELFNKIETGDTVLITNVKVRLNNRKVKTLYGMEYIVTE